MNLISISQRIKMFTTIYSWIANQCDYFMEYLIHKPVPFPIEKINQINSSRSRLFDVYTDNNDKISGIEIYAKNSDGPHSNKYIIYSHGNKGNITTNFDYLLKLSDELNINIVTYDYIGYGLSEKKQPTEQGCYDSLKQIILYVKNNKRVNADDIYLVGRSLGTGVVIDYVSKNKWNTPIILISPYKNIISTYVNIYPFPNKFNSIDKIKNIKCPIKIFHGEDDNIVDISHASELYQHVRNKKFRPTWFRGTGHADILSKITGNNYEEILEKN